MYQKYTYKNITTNGTHLTKDKFCLLNIPDLKNCTVLDIGCAEGFISLKCSESAKKVVAIDTNAGYIKILKQITEKLEIKNIETITISAQKILENRYFDYIFCLSVLHLQIDPLGLIQQISTRCKQCYFEIDVYDDEKSESFFYFRRQLFESNRIHISLGRKSIMNFLQNVFKKVKMVKQHPNARQIYHCANE